MDNSASEGAGLLCFGQEGGRTRFERRGQLRDGIDRRNPTPFLHKTDHLAGEAGKLGELGLAQTESLPPPQENRGEGMAKLAALVGGLQWTF